MLANSIKMTLTSSEFSEDGSLVRGCDEDGGGDGGRRTESHHVTGFGGRQRTPKYMATNVHLNCLEIQKI